MVWRKLGLVFAPAGNHPWMLSHASNPTPEPRGDNLVRVYFGSRDERNRAHVAWVEMEMTPTPKVVRIADEPTVVPGTIGGFDDSGISMGCLVQNGERTLLYYVGWNLCVTVPWRNSIGLAIREGRDGPFVKYSPAPLLDRCAVDPFTLSYPFVLREGPLWRMWYGSSLRWTADEKEMDHVIKYAESNDGLNWDRTGEIALGLGGDGEFALCRPWVEKRADGYRMWCCHRGAAYRIGRADSRDGRTWQRQDAGIDVSPEGWDSDMIAYPSTFVHNDRRYMLYSGNRYGKTGFGIAIEAAT